MDLSLSFLKEVAEFLRGVPITFFAAVFAVYFGYLKITNKITFSYSCAFRDYGGKLSDFTLQNRRDKVYIIQSIYCVLVDGKIIKLKSFHPPLILKPYEVAVVEFDDISEWRDKNTGAAYEPDFMETFHIEVFTQGKGIINCAREFKSEYKEATIQPHTSKLNNIILTKNMKFILIAWIKSTEVNIIFYPSGFLEGDRNFGGYNFIALNDGVELNLDDITSAIFDKGFDKQWDSFEIYQVDNFSLTKLYSHTPE